MLCELKRFRFISSVLHAFLGPKRALGLGATFLRCDCDPRGARAVAATRAQDGVQFFDQEPGARFAALHRVARGPSRMLGCGARQRSGAPN